MLLNLNTYLCFPLAPGGTLSDDMTRTEFCLFTAQEDLETMQAYAQVNSSKQCNGAFICLGSERMLSCLFLCLKVFNKLIRRYKYLEKGFEEEIKKVSV